MIIEWNAHMFSSDTERYPFHPRAAYTRDASRWEVDPVEAYTKRLEDEGIDRAVLVHPEPYGDDHRLVLDCVAKNPDRFKATSLFYPKDKDAPSKLTDLVAEHPEILATRFHKHRGKEMYLDSFADSGVRALWEKAAELGLVVELHIGPDHAAGCEDLILAHAETPVLIDHLAEPHKEDAVEYADVLGLARFENVCMKLSGLNHFSNDEPLYENARPFTRRVVEAFGPDQLVWGSGTPGIVEVHMPDHSDSDRAKVLGGNVARLLGWAVGEARDQ